MEKKESVCEACQKDRSASAITQPIMTLESLELPYTEPTTNIIQSKEISFVLSHPPMTDDDLPNFSDFNFSNFFEATRLST